MPKLHIFPQNIQIAAAENQNLLDALRSSGVFPDAPCGGNGICGKCRVMVDGEAVLACRTEISRDMTVTIPCGAELQVLQAGKTEAFAMAPVKEGYLVAMDIGTTSVVCYLLDGKTGAELAQSSMLNPQVAFGADVISRIQAALRGEMEKLTKLIRDTAATLIQNACADADVCPNQIGVVSLVGNPAMQQLFLGIEPENLVNMPFAPALTEAKTMPCADVLPICPDARLLIVPNISGYIGADTIGCILATRLHEAEEMTLLVDIGTNGEMVLGNRERLVACATAAGPALEGAGITFGMRAAPGAIDHVWVENGEVRCSVIGGAEAKGICGSGLVDAVRAALELGYVNHRGRIQNQNRIIPITDRVYLTQEDIRQVQLAKGAIFAGILLMAKQLGIGVGDIRKVQLAGAFGNYLNPQSACRIGLLPEELLDKIEAVGNAAGSGAKLLACDKSQLPVTQELVSRIEYLELASLPDFSRTLADGMYFREAAR